MMFHLVKKKENRMIEIKEKEKRKKRKEGRKEKIKKEVKRRSKEGIIGMIHESIRIA